MLATTSVEGSVQSKAKCDFCDLHLKTDLDISRHLSSDSHRNKIAQFLSLQNLNTKSIQKEVPKNLVEVLKSLRLRSERDVKELADKTFFKIYDDAIAEIVLELNKSFFKSLVEFETRSLPPGVRTAFINALGPQEEPANESKRIESQPTKLPPKTAKLAKTINHEESAQSNAKVLPEQQPRTTPSVQRSNPESQPVRKPGQIPRIQEQEQTPKHQNQPQLNTSRQIQQTRPHQQSKSTLHEKPIPPQPKQSQPSPVHSPQALGKNQTSFNDGQPLPRPNSTYVPKIAVVPRIKTEPKDD